MLRRGPQPFLRWAGGKRALLPYLLNSLPADIEERPYVEPFLGAGSLFFALAPHNAFVGDANEHLIRCYECVREEPNKVHKYLRYLVSKNSEKFYYLTRDKYNSSSFDVKQAARFIYLNCACYNGIFRVNRKGEFNVPYGRKEPPPYPTSQQLISASNVLQKASIKSGSCEGYENDIKSGDFFYLDPPYPPLNGTAYFTHYTKDRFDELDQIKVALFVNKVNAKGALFMVSNADVPTIRKLYRDYNILSVPTTRFISCKAHRLRVTELIITNYEAGDGR
ncbi:MAG: Dam family site-specific DNA-(adenine-N6)-methyltransferase [Desulfarculaceae bacterium]|nr:Dam family site-specific DNA-(adenine-N6)-methyltransferase [Desulfarculaceae bacterium]MCF8121661.1 Dam family site-specific DNA-(adenine-N6)-methyltransferase [Desulfarculaceae bacterium]